MSYWTHVAAFFRIRQDSWIHKNPDYTKLIGRECLWYDASEETWERAWKHPDEFLPMGLEGSCRMRMVCIDDDITAGGVNIIVFGDLRGVESTDDVEAWFKRACANVDAEEDRLGISVGQAVCHVHCDFGDVDKTLTYGVDVKGAEA